MKTINRIFWHAAFPLAFVACQSEDIITENVEQGAEVHTLQGIMGGSYQSRAQVELNRTEVEKERFIWNREDQITLYDIDAETTTGNTFRIAESYNDNPQYGNPSGEATFITETPVTAGHQVTAVYPAQTVEPENGIITLSIPYESTIDANNLESEWKNYMRQNMYMYAPATEANGDISMEFRHFCAMARITYTNSTTEAVNLTRCELKNSGIFLALEATLDVKTGKLTPIGDKAVRVNFKNLTVGPGLSQEIYLLFFPGENFIGGATLTFSIYTEGNKTPSTAVIPLSEISGNNAGIQSYEVGKRYWFRLMQTPKGLIWKSDMKEGTISNANLINIIRGQIGENTLVMDENGFVIVEESKDALNQVTTIEGTFDNLEDIKYLPNLERLVCLGNGNHPITKLDVSQNTKLKTLECCNSALTSLDVSNNPELTSLICYDNKLTSLDLSKNTKLQVLNCSNNKLTSLDVSNNAALNSLSCYGNGLTSLNISQNTKLTFLDCQVNNLQSLDVTRLTELRALYCGNNIKLATLDISRNMSLTYLDYGYTSIPSLDVSKHTALTYLACGGEKTTSLDISKNIALETLRCENSSLTSLDISKNVNLIELSCCYSRIQELDITANPNIKHLQCGGQRKGNNEINMSLILTADQNTLWESSWVEDAWGNSNVTPRVKE